MQKDIIDVVLLSFQVHWVPPVGSVTRHPGGQTAARSCVVAGATTPRAWNASQSASASLSGVAPWSVKTARRPSTSTPAKPPNVPNGWTRPETCPPPPHPQDFVHGILGHEAHPLRSLSPSPTYSLHGFIWTVFVKALQMKSTFPMSALHTMPVKADLSFSLPLCLLFWIDQKTVKVWEPVL